MAVTIACGQLVLPQMMGTEPDTAHLDSGREGAWLLALPCSVPEEQMLCPPSDVANFFLFLRGGWGELPRPPLPTLVTFSPRVECPHFGQVEASLAFPTQVRQCPFLSPPSVNLWVSLLLSPS